MTVGVYAEVELDDVSSEDLLDELLRRDLKDTRFDEVLAYIEPCDLAHVLKKLG